MSFEGITATKFVILAVKSSPVCFIYKTNSCHVELNPMTAAAADIITMLHVLSRYILKDTVALWELNLHQINIY